MSNYPFLESTPGLTVAAAKALGNLSKQVGYLAFFGSRGITHIWREKGSLCGLPAGRGQLTTLSPEEEFLNNHVCKRCTKSMKKYLR